MKKITKYLTLLLFGAATMSTQAQTEITVHDDRNNADEVISLPEGMTLDTDSLLREWNARHYLYPDTTCENPDYNPPFAEEVYRDRLARIPAVMEMPHNEIVQRFIDQYSGRLRRSVSYMLGAGNFYVPIFEEALDFYGLPLELKYLPVIESALDPTAVSRAGAVGLWQFMLPTGKRYGLEVNSLVDERRDPIKSTYAAAHYLSDLYKIFNDWSLVIAAYNCGPATVTRAIHRAGGAKDYWTIYPHLPKETRGYVPAFIAANYIMTYYCEHNICPMKTKYPVTTDTVLVSRDLHIDQIAAYCGVDRAAIKALNPQYRTDIIPGKSAPRILRLPQESLLAFIDNQDSIYNYRSEELLTRRATVAVNDAPAVRNETAGRTSRKSTSTRKGRNSRKSSGSRSTTVRKGDTLSEIAARNHTTVSRLRKLNGIKGDRINPGQKLKVK